MTKKSERQPIKAENVAGGAGYILKEELIKGEQLGAYCKMFNEVTLKPGCEIGYHEHHGETETYYLTKGAGIYNDNGKEYPVEVGDVTFCADGNGHGIKNTDAWQLRSLYKKGDDVRVNTDTTPIFVRS